MQEEHSIITECPGCETRFRVSQGQLKIADGQVRCGHCLLVFSALECQPAKQTSIPDSSVSSPSTSGPNSDFAIPGHEPFAMATEINQVSATATQADDLAEVISEQTGTNESHNQQAAKTVAVEATPAVTSEVLPENQKSVFKDKKAPTLTIHPEPISLNAGEHHRPFAWHWMLACAFALFGLTAQFLWFERETLYWKPHLQPLYQQFCLHIDCQLPHRSRIDLISSEQFLLRDHSDIEGALTMEIILTNQAGFSQPYPALKLSFADLKGRLVAKRIFQPHTYLNSNTPKDAMMPVNQPVLISLEIMSPGTRAVSYELSLLAPEQ